jgi:hypothetical protein
MIEDQNQMLAVFDGRTCAGHILPRGRAGFEAFDASDRSLGLFETWQAAASSIPDSAEQSK